MTREASTYSRSRMDRTTDRTTRTTDGRYATESANTIAPSPPAKTAMKPSASSIPGKANKASLMVINTRSVQPRRNPAKVPNKAPAVMAQDTVAQPIPTLMRAPAMALLRTSRPNSSVPNQCRHEGGAKGALRSIARGPYGVQNCATPTVSNSSPTSTKPNSDCTGNPVLLQPGMLRSPSRADRTGGREDP